MNESSGKGTLLRRKEAGILTLTLNRPDRMNAINHDMFFAIARAAETAAVDPEVRVVVFTGAGSVFCSGGDITGLADRPAEAGGKEAYKRTFREIQGVFDKVEAIPQPTIAAINGHVLGGGLQLALACDFRIAVREAKFGLPDVKNGIIPGLGGTTRLPRLIGLAKAKELIMTGDPITPEEALRIGLIYRVVEREELEGAVAELAGKLASRAPLALAAAKALLDGEAGLDEVAEAQIRLIGSNDAREGITAFFEKRRPRFTGT